MAQARTRSGRGRVVALEAADAGPGHDRSEVGILAGSLRDPPPAGVAGDVDHGGEGPLQPGGGGLGRGDPRRSLDGRRVPATRLAQGDREDRAVAVDHVEAEEQRDLQPRLLDGQVLGLVDVPRPADVEERADQARAGSGRGARRGPATSFGDAVELLQLADLLLEGHPREQLVDPPLDLPAPAAPTWRPRPEPMMVMADRSTREAIWSGRTTRISSWRRSPCASLTERLGRGGQYGDVAGAFPSSFAGEPMTKIVLLRHGESIWNKENLFTGWTDVDLSEQGKAEAKRAGELLKAEGFTFDVAFTSVLKRAIRTLWIALDELDLMWIPVDHSWRLNERHYGALQGLNKAQTAAKYGDEQVLVWRRSYDIPPPPLEESDPRYPGTDPRYKGLSKAELPLTECLKDTVARFLPYWHETIVPTIQDGQEGDHRRPRQQPPGPGQVPRQHLGPGDRRPEHPHRRPPGLRAGRPAQADQALLPRRPRRGRPRRRGRGQPGQGEVTRPTRPRASPRWARSAEANGTVSLDNRPPIDGFVRGTECRTNTRKCIL